MMRPNRCPALTALLITAALLLSGCAHLPPEREPARVLDEQEQREIIQDAQSEFEEFILELVVPRVMEEVPELIERGYADRVGTGDLYHVHLRYPQVTRLQKGVEPEAFFRRSHYHLLYHTHENPYQKRDQWIRQVRGLDDDQINEWLERLEARSFDYDDFFYGSGSYRFGDSIDTETVRTVARTSKEKLVEAGWDVSTETMVNRVRFILGPSQEGFDEAFDTLFRPHSIRSVEQDGATRFQPIEARYDEGYWHPATIYFYPIVRRSFESRRWEPTSAAVESYLTGEPGGRFRRYGAYLIRVHVLISHSSAERGIF